MSQESKEDQINLNISLTLPGSGTENASGTYTVRKFTLMGKTLDINDGNSSDQQRLTHAMPLSPDAEAEINLMPTQRVLLDKRFTQRQMQLLKKEMERDRSVRIGEGREKLGKNLHESIAKNIGSSSAMEYSKPIGGENCNAATVHPPTDNEEVVVLEKLSYDCAVAKSRARNPGKMLATIETKNPGKKPQASSPCGHCIETPTPLLELLAQMPGVMVVDPTGQAMQGILVKFGPDQIKIMCICHGGFFSAVDFVKHAGWDEVTNPIQRIIVLPENQ